MRSADGGCAGPCEVSVNICTYNRHRMLQTALESLLSDQGRGGVSYEIVVVDNNSTDDTRAVVERFVSRGHANVRYVFEERQGLSHARNAAISAARSPILAFTDDDVQVGPQWVATIKQSFDAHPEVDCVGGKVLPRWTHEPPDWLTTAHWAPLAIVDYGDRPFLVNANRPVCLVTANMAIRKDAIEQIGRFQPDLQRVHDSIGSMEDHELQIRLWRANRQALYVPELVVISEIAPERVSQRYHRRWHRGHGRYYAMARLPEMEQSRTGHLFDVSAHMYRQAAVDASHWVVNMARGRRSRAFLHETNLQFFRGFFGQRYRDFQARTRSGPVHEIVRFARSLVTGVSA